MDSGFRRNDGWVLFVACIVDWRVHPTTLGGSGVGTERPVRLWGRMMQRFVGVCCIAVVMAFVGAGCLNAGAGPDGVIPEDAVSSPEGGSETAENVSHTEGRADETRGTLATEEIIARVAPTFTPVAPTTEVPDRMESGETDLQLPGAPSVTPVASSSGFPAAYVSPSIDEQILRSGIIVRSQLDSVQAATETVDSGDGQSTSYRAVHELRFRAIEYLKGNGPGAVTVVVRGSRVFENNDDALASAQSRVDTRNTFWDEREAILFLNVSTAEYGSASERSPVRGAVGLGRRRCIRVHAFEPRGPGGLGLYD